MLTCDNERVGTAGFKSHAEALVSPLGANIDRELLLMKNVLGQEADERDFQAIREQVCPCLESLKEMLLEEQIQPWRQVRLSPHEPEPEQPRTNERILRLGFFPTAANPLHWMHLMGGLLAMSHFQLDKVIYVIAGSDCRKTNLLPATIRHMMVARVLRAFSPFFVCTPITVESSLPGEVNVFRLLQLNSGLKIEAFYIAGTDHCRRFDPVTGEPDTLQRLEDGIRSKLYGFDERRRSLSVIFLDRGGPARPADTFLKVQMIDRLPLHMSSTRIRDALSGRGPSRALAGIPFTTFTTIRALRLYEETPLGAHRERKGLEGSCELTGRN